MTRHVIGIQLHHSTFLADARAGLANMLAGLRGAHDRTKRPEIQALIAEAEALASGLAEEHARARASLRSFYEERDFKRYRDGDLPWPDEDPEGFVARCRCRDACGFHDFGRGTPDDDCSCGQRCYRHPRD